MKVLVLILLMSGAASAQTAADPLQVPADLPAAQQRACHAAGFNADDTVYGFCYTINAGACSGRGCQPTLHYTVYEVAWADDTSTISMTFCATRQYHRPAVDIWTYQPGFDATNCYLPPWPGTGPVQLIIVGGITQYAYFLSASQDGAYGLWNVFGGSWLGEF